MLWLPKWLHESGERLEAEMPSRRTFLFMGASAAVGALVAPPLEGWGERLFAGVDPAEPYIAFYKARLYARVTIPRNVMLMHSIEAPGPGPFVQAMRSETARALAEARENARLAGFTIGDSRWEDADGNVLFKVEANTHAERRRALAAIPPEDRFIVTEDA